jgi:hypothetical protein
MLKLKIGWAVLLLILYGIFWIWYGGNGDPLSQAEGEAMIKQMEQTYGMTVEDAPEGSMIRNLTAMLPNDDGKEFYAVNLETRKKGTAALESESKYSDIVVPLLFERGGHPVFMSERAGLMLGKYGDKVDRVAVVRYRSLRDLMDMILDPAMLVGRKFKYGALEHTEVFITRPTITFVQVRLLVGLLFLIVGIIGWKLIDWRRSSRQNAGTTE